MSLQPLLSRWFHQVDVAPLAAFRILFGAVMTWEVWRYFHHEKIARYYLSRPVHFTYPIAEFVSPLPPMGMYAVFLALGICAFLIFLGLFYRVAAPAFLLLYTYVFLADATEYNNHYYFICLLAFLLCFTDAHRLWSLDARRTPGNNERAPAWQLRLLQFQVLLVYFFGGIAKINPDWLRAEPLRHWLATRADYPLIGPFLNSEPGAYFFSYGGLLFDLGIGPLLLWRKTRLPAIVLLCLFHGFNSWIFSIGVFPILSIAAIVLFLNHRGQGVPEQPNLLATAFVGIYVGMQVFLPLRHWLMPGNPSWTEEGHLLAWHMKLRSKGGNLYFYLATNQRNLPFPADALLDRRQIRKMKTRPQQILQFAHYLRDKLAKKGVKVRITALCEISLNYRPQAPLISPHANLAEEEYSIFRHNPWILTKYQ